MTPGARPEELAARCDERAEEGNISLAGLTVDECEDLFYGRVPPRVREMARTAFDWYFEDLLERNAAKPVRKKKSGGR